MDFATRYDFLKTIVTRYDSYYNLAAVKASLLLTSNAIFLAPSLGEKGHLLDAATHGTVAQALLIFSAVLSLVSIVYAALVIASYLSSQKRAARHGSLVFTRSVADMSVEDYTQGVEGVEEAAVIHDLAQVAHMLASGLASKFRYINFSLLALVSAILCACLALVF